MHQDDLNKLVDAATDNSFDSGNPGVGQSGLNLAPVRRILPPRIPEGINEGDDLDGPPAVHTDTLRSRRRWEH